jgi:hypothetical protein
MKRLAFASLVLLSAPAWAKPSSVPNRAQIDAAIDDIRSFESAHRGSTFDQNVAHLAKKLGTAARSSGALEEWWFDTAKMDDGKGYCRAVALIPTPSGHAVFYESTAFEAGCSTITVKRPQVEAARTVEGSAYDAIKQQMETQLKAPQRKGTVQTASWSFKDGASCKNLVYYMESGSDNGHELTEDRPCK